MEGGWGFSFSKISSSTQKVATPIQTATATANGQSPPVHEIPYMLQKYACNISKITDEDPTRIRSSEENTCKIGERSYLCRVPTIFSTPSCITKFESQSQDIDKMLTLFWKITPEYNPVENIKKDIDKSIDMLHDKLINFVFNQRKTLEYNTDVLEFLRMPGSRVRIAYKLNDARLFISKHTIGDSFTGKNKSLKSEKYPNINVYNSAADYKKEIEINWKLIHDTIKQLGEYIKLVESFKAHIETQIQKFTESLQVIKQDVQLIYLQSLIYKEQISSGYDYETNKNEIINSTNPIQGKYEEYCNQWITDFKEILQKYIDQLKHILELSTIKTNNSNGKTSFISELYNSVKTNTADFSKQFHPDKVEGLGPDTVRTWFWKIDDNRTSRSDSIYKDIIDKYPQETKENRDKPERDTTKYNYKFDIQDNKFEAVYSKLSGSVYYVTKNIFNPGAPFCKETEGSKLAKAVYDKSLQSVKSTARKLFNFSNGTNASGGKRRTRRLKKRISKNKRKSRNRNV
jgi:hypothetical protein